MLRRNFRWLSTFYSGKRVESTTLGVRSSNLFGRANHSFTSSLFSSPDGRGLATFLPREHASIGVRLTGVVMQRKGSQPVERWSERPAPGGRPGLLGDGRAPLIRRRDRLMAWSAVV